MNRFARIICGREDWAPHARVSRHRHAHAYAAVVLAGGYEECGSHGRFRVKPGDVLMHNAFDAHLDRFAPRTTQILNVLLGPMPWQGPVLCRVKDADAIARKAETDASDAASCLLDQLDGVVSNPMDWPDLLASALIANPRLRLGQWARMHGLSAEAVSRGFRKVFAVTPAAFRTEAMAQAAFARIMEGRMALAAIAAETGFADQPHMSRATKALTGRTPSAWRTSSPPRTVACDTM
jgi:AraC-like DNA-binding protein